MKNYDQIIRFLRKNVVYRKKPKQTVSNWLNTYNDQLKFDKVFNEILKITKKIDKIYPINIESFCNKYLPNKIRIRSDSFLSNARSCKLNDIFIIFSCVKIEHKKTYIVLTSNHFTNYTKSISSSNSFFIKDFTDLKNWANSVGEISKNETRIRGIGKTTTYLYWHGNENHMEKLTDYLSILSQIENYTYYLKEKNKKNLRVSISKDTKNEIFNFYNNECALRQINKCLTMESRINDNISKHIHHIIPLYYFYDQKIFDDKIINNKNNLVLLCFKCHMMLSSHIKLERKKILDWLLESMKKTNKFIDFQNYLWDDLHITIPILYRIYGVDYE